MLMVLHAVAGLADAREEENEDISIEFLEFLSEWETDQGDWVGPDGFIDDSFDQLYEAGDENNDETQE